MKIAFRCGICGLFFVITWLMSPALVAARADTVDASGAAGLKTLVIAYASHLGDAAKQWQAYRTSQEGGSWNVVLHEVGEEADAAAQRESLREFIRHAYREAAPNGASDLTFAVMLLGDADAMGIATWMFPQNDPVMQGHGDRNEFASDHPYQVTGEKAVSPELALGRVPAQSNDEALALLKKITIAERQIQVEADAAKGGGLAPIARGRNRVVYAAGEGRFGAMDGVLEELFKTMVDRMVPDSFDLSMTYAKSSSAYCPPPSKLTETVLQRMSEGAVLFNYLGHGFAQGFDSLHWAGKRFPILRTGDLKRLPSEPIAGTQRPIAFLSCCSAGWYDLPEGRQSLAEAMLFHPSGPVAVIAGSRITHPYANTILQKDITHALLNERAATVGVLDLHATQSLVKADEMDRELDAIAMPIAFAGKWKTSLAGLRQMHVKLYNLLGDPAMRIALPAASITDLKAGDGAVTGRIDGMKKGRVYVSAETARTSFVNASKLLEVIGDNDPELEAKAANNYPLVNDRVLARIECEVADGAFRAPLPAALSPATFIVRVYAIGFDDAANPMDAIGALRLMPAPAKAATTIASP
jgi:hypothetical protein